VLNFDLKLLINMQDEPQYVSIRST